MAAALANVEEDNWEWHTFDTVKGGDYLVDQDAAEILAKEAIDAVIDLENMGLPFNRTPEGKIDQRRFGGHTADHGKTPVRRACYAADRTGHMILQTLFQNCVKLGINFFNEFYVLDLITVKADDGSTQVAGVVAYELATGDLHVFQAKAVIFATGGFGKIYKTTSNAHTLTGDGVGIIWRKGLPLEDMEFFQFHPTGLAGLGILLTEGARGEGAILRNASRRALHGALRPHHQGPRAARHRRPLHGAGGRRGPRRRPAQGLRAARLHAPRRRGARDQAPRHHRVRAHLPRRRPGRRAGAGHADRALRDGRHPDQQRRRGARATTPPSSPACTPPASARACRCTAPTASAPTRCSTSTCSASAPASNAVEYVKTAEFVPLPEDPAAEVREHASRACATDAAPSASPCSARSCRTRWTRTPRCSAPTSPSTEVLGRHRRAARALQEHRTSTTRASGSTPTCSRPSSSGFLLDLAEVVVVRRAQPQGEPRRPHARRLSRRATTRTTCSTRWPTCPATPHSSNADDHIRLDWKPVVFIKNEPAS